MLLRTATTLTGFDMVNLMVTDYGNNTDSFGKIQVLNGSSWNSVSGLTVNFSTDTNSNGIFDNGDIVVRNIMTIVGNYDATASYTITLNGDTSIELSAFQGSAPASTTLKRAVFLTGGYVDNTYLVDAIPEPVPTRY